MFKLLLPLLFSSLTYAQVTVNTHPHLLFKYAPEIPTGSEMVSVKTMINNRVPGHGPMYYVVSSKPAFSIEVPLMQFEMEKKLAQAVFRAQTGTGTAQGTAFLISKDQVLTNHHVLANETECRKFGIFINNKDDEFVACKQVLYCSKVHDFCLIQMDALKDGSLLGEVLTPLKFSQRNPSPTELALIIGNPLATGIHGASYAGIKDLGDDWGHFTLAQSGNSGSPLMDKDGLVIGIHYGRADSAALHGGPDDRDMGLAVKTKTILKEISTLLEVE